MSKAAGCNFFDWMEDFAPYLYLTQCVLLLVCLCYCLSGCYFVLPAVYIDAWGAARGAGLPAAAMRAYVGTSTRMAHAKVIPPWDERSASAAAATPASASSSSSSSAAAAAGAVEPPGLARNPYPVAAPAPVFGPLKVKLRLRQFFNRATYRYGWTIYEKNRDKPVGASAGDFAEALQAAKDAAKPPVGRHSAPNGGLTDDDEDGR